jgi:hypothetical protein
VQYETNVSMFVYCTEVLHLSEHEAYLRIQVARASRKHPVLLEMLEDGRLHLSGISVLHAHLTEANHKTLLKRAAHKSKRQILELVAEIAPKEDAPATMRRLPERREPMETTPKNQLGPDLRRENKSLCAGKMGVICSHFGSRDDQARMSLNHSESTWLI